MSDIQLLMLAGFMFVGLPALVFLAALIVSWFDVTSTNQPPTDHQ